VQALAKAAEKIDLAEPAQSGLAQEGEELCRACLIHPRLVARNRLRRLWERQSTIRRRAT
jgi:hypothetical protein